MDPVKTGALIKSLRVEKGLTQNQLADLVGVSDKAVSKWETGNGFPDLSIFPRLAELFGVDSERLLAGEMDPGNQTGGNMKKTKFYICPVCGNILTAMTEASVSCCGKKLEGQSPKKAEPGERLNVEMIENDYFVTTDHPMTKEHYITFAALLTGDSLILRKQYPEWDLQTRLPRIGRGMLVWACNQHGLFYQLV
ncbi:MAG: helix-turn-helix domain-containing protein [Clostridiales bacterium]|nr:helix-turn-helix domain-containing protein [Clostridiales bacterium]